MSVIFFSTIDYIAYFLTNVQAGYNKYFLTVSDSFLLSQNLLSVIKRTATFLNVTLETADETKLVDFLQYDKVPSRSGDEEGSESGNDKLNLANLGKAGSWRSSMTPALAEKFDKWTKEKLAGTDFSNVFMII